MSHISKSIELIKDQSSEHPINWLKFKEMEQIMLETGPNGIFRTKLIKTCFRTILENLLDPIYVNGVIWAREP